MPKIQMQWKSDHLQRVLTDLWGVIFTAKATSPFLYCNSFYLIGGFFPCSFILGPACAGWSLANVQFSAFEPGLFSGMLS